MALLDSVLEVRDASKPTGGGNYLNPSSIDKDQTVRITILGTNHSAVTSAGLPRKESGSA